MADLTDGTSSTYMVAEKYLNPDRYFDGGTGCDDESMVQGDDFGVNRYTCLNQSCRPRQDQLGAGLCLPFGSAH